MYGRSSSAAFGRGFPRRMVRERPRPDSVPVDWVQAHRAARIDARCRQAQDRAIRLARGRWRQC